MMDVLVLAKETATFLAPLLPFLLKAGETAAEEAGKKAAGAGWEWAKSLWSKIRPKVEACPAAVEAVRDVAQDPTSDDLHVVLRVQLGKLLAEDRALSDEVSNLLRNARAAGVTVIARGERSVAIGGDVSGSAIITGDRNISKPK